MEPSLKNCSTQWNDDSAQPLCEVFRNQAILSSKIVAKNDLGQLQFKFSSEMDPITMEPIQLAFSLNDFQGLDGDDDMQAALFKFAALNLINAVSDT